MPCQVSKLSHAFCVQGGNEWAMLAHGDNCPVDEMLAAGFFNPANSLLRTGDLVLMGSVPLPRRSEEVCRSDGGRKLLAMVAGIEKGQVRLRILIDLGGPIEGHPRRAHHLDFVAHVLPKNDERSRHHQASCSADAASSSADAASSSTSSIGANL